jgi:DNA-binding GntR family transcriptional regulator
LAARGLVESTFRRGVIVARIGVEELTDMLEAECEIEALCARLASQKMSALEKQHLQLIHDQAAEVVRRKKTAHYMALNEQFHTVLAAGSRNETLMSTVRMLRDRLAPFRQAQAEDEKQRFARSLDEHTLVVGAIMKGDPEQAYLTMRAHNARLSTGVLFRLRDRAASAPTAMPSLVDPPPTPVGSKEHEKPRDRGGVPAGRKLVKSRKR